MLTRALVTLGLAALAQGQQEPSFLVILADDLGVDGVGFLDAHPTPPTTPRLDALAAEGVVFRRAYVSPLCSPSRACLLTGKDAWRTGVGANVTKYSFGDGISLDETTIAHELGPRWRRVKLGKWHLSTENELALDPPGLLGFDDYRGTWRNISGGQTYWRWLKTVDQVELPLSTYATTDNVDDAIRELEGGEGPLFLLLSLNAPHAPWHAAPAHLAGPPASQAPADLYLTAIEAMDTEVGRLLDALDQSTYASSTYVMFLGDNGTPSDVVRPPTRPDRVKGSVYEGGVHVPLVVRGPGVEPRVVDDLVQGTDLYATLAELAGVDASTPDSVSFAPVLRGESGARDHVYVEAFGPWYASPYHWWRRTVISRRWKLIDYHSEPDELYDLILDPSEDTDLLAQGPDALSSEARSAYAWLRARMDAEGAGLFD